MARKDKGRGPSPAAEGRVSGTQPKTPRRAVSKATAAARPSRKSSRGVRAEAAAGLDVEAVATAAAPAGEVFQTLGRLRDDLESAAEKMARTAPEDVSASREETGALLASQRRILAEIKTTLSSLQHLIETSERLLDAESAGPRTAVSGGNAAPVLDPTLAFRLPWQALEAMQQVALGQADTWARVAQGYQGLWLDAMQAWSQPAGRKVGGRPERERRASPAPHAID